MIEKFTYLFIKNKKRAIPVILLFALGIMLIAFSAAGGEASKGSEGITLEEYKARLEKELEDLCSSVDGVGRCRVMVTFERGEENTYKGSSLIETKPPRVCGISVICRGGDSAEVKRAVTEMLTAAFDIGSNRVSVLKLNS